MYLHYPYGGPDRAQDRFWFNEDGLFQYYGRKSFRRVLDRVSELKMVGSNGYRQMYIHGVEGYGKSHLISAVICHLLSVRERILYIPDCRWLTIDPFSCLRDRFRLAFADGSYVLELLHECSSNEDLVRLSDKLADHGVTMKVFADQANALDVGSIELLNRIAYRHFFIRTASANFELPV